MIKELNEFIDEILSIDMNLDNKYNVNKLFNTLECLDIDLFIPKIKKSVIFNDELKLKLIYLINYYYNNIEDNINNYEYNKSKEFLINIKNYASPISKVLKNLKLLKT